MNVPTLDLTQLNNRGNPWPLFDPNTKSFDCNVVKTIEVNKYATGHELTVQQARQIGGVPGAKPTGTVLTGRVLKSEGLVQGTDFILAKKPRLLPELKGYLHDGWYVGLFVDYEYLNKNGAVTGDRNYMGLHCVGLWGWRLTKGVRLVWEHDPLFDGRHPYVPFGRQHVPFWPLAHAAEAAIPKQFNGMDGTGKWTGWAVKIPL